jgi:hypothetical protein
MRRLACIAALALVSACGSDGGSPPVAGECAILPGGATPESVDHLGCAADYAALGYSEDPFVTLAHTMSVSVILDRQADRAYFLDTRTWWLHFDFVWQVLGGHAADDPGKAAAQRAFIDENYYSEQRHYLLGKIVQYRDQGLLVYSLAAGDKASAALIRAGFLAVRSHLYDGERLVWHAVSGDQEALVAAVGADIPVVTSEALFAGQTYQPLNAATGYGVLRFRRSAQLAAEPPLPTELVVLDRVPADIPVVGGIITGEFQTPLSHINILAKNRGTPNMALRNAFDEPTLRAFDGQLVKLVVSRDDYTIAAASEAEAQAYRERLRPATVHVPVYDPSVTGVVRLAGHGVEDLDTLGGKASNFAEMSRANPTVRLPSPAFAVPLSAFDAHMTANGLWPEVEAIVAERAAGTLDESGLARRLFHLRRAIYLAPLPEGLGAALYQPVHAAVGDGEVRLRSSTNVEDLPGFSGAGLYTSVGVVLGEGQARFENGLKVVWASTYNEAAFIEREFYRVEERGVRMAALVHPSITGELANGVALTQNQFDDIRPGYIIDAQAGDISVTNPSGAATPEQVLYYPSFATPEYEVLARSSITHGAPVLVDAQYADLAESLRRMRNHFTPIWCQIPGTTMIDPGCCLDIEWKLEADGQITIKQARPLRSGATAAAP